MRKLNIVVEADLMLPVKVKLGLLVRADAAAGVDRIVTQFAKGNLRTSKADVEGVEIEVAEVEDGLYADEPLAAHVGSCSKTAGGSP